MTERKETTKRKDLKEFKRRYKLRDVDLAYMFGTTAQSISSYINGGTAVDKTILLMVDIFDCLLLDYQKTYMLELARSKKYLVPIPKKESNPVKKFCHINKLTPLEFADIFCVTSRTARRYINGTRKPNWGKCPRPALTAMRWAYFLYSTRRASFEKFDEAFKRFDHLKKLVAGMRSK